MRLLGVTGVYSLSFYQFMFFTVAVVPLAVYLLLFVLAAVLGLALTFVFTTRLLPLASFSLKQPAPPTMNQRNLSHLFFFQTLVYL